MPVIGHATDNGHLSFIYKLGQNDFLRTITDAVHNSDPCHLVSCFQVLCYTLSGFHLLNDNFQAVLCPLVQISQIRPERTVKAKSIKPDRVMLLKIISVHTPQTTNGSVFFR